MTYQALVDQFATYSTALEAAADRAGRDAVREALRPDAPAIFYAPLTDVGLFELVRDNEWEVGYDAGSGIRRCEDRPSHEPYAAHAFRERLALLVSA